MAVSGRRSSCAKQSCGGRTGPLQVAQSPWQVAHVPLPTKVDAAQVETHEPLIVSWPDGQAVQ